MTTNPNSVTIVLTGATGAFGRFLTMELLRHPETRLILLVRGGSHEEAIARVKNLVGENRGRVEVLRSDLAQERLGLSESDYDRLSNMVTHIVHSAASVRFNRPLEEARRYNVEPARKMIEFAKKCPHLIRFGAVGTALVAGNRSGIIKEDEFEHSSGFKNTYEKSKYEAEALMRSNSADLPLVIFRPPLLLTPASTSTIIGASSSLPNALILGANLVARGIITFLPGTEDSAVDVVDGRVAAKAIVDLMLKPSLSHGTYHITNGDYAPRVKSIRALIEKKTGQPVSLAFYGSAEAYREQVRRIAWYHFKMKHAHERISSFITELAYPKIYDNAHTLDELGIPRLESDPMKVVAEAFDNVNTWRFSA